MNRLVIERLLDITAAAALAREHARSTGSEQLFPSAKERDAALYQLAVIGEAVTHLPVHLQALEPGIPWVRIRGMRNHIVHAYWQIDFGIITAVIEMHLGPLTAAVERLIAITENDV
jgi:uncharacterized protein with HEPN domain